VPSTIQHNTTLDQCKDEPPRNFLWSFSQSY